MSWEIQLIACFAASLSFSVLVRQPKGSMLVSAVIATAGYSLFLLMGQNTLAYFTATLLIGLSCEICARIMKRAATLFVTGAIIPLVPGVGLYNTMRYVVEGNYHQAMSTGASTVLGLCAIALAITTTSVLFSAFFSQRGKKAAP